MLSLIIELLPTTHAALPFIIRGNIKHLTANHGYMTENSSTSVLLHDEKVNCMSRECSMIDRLIIMLLVVSETHPLTAHN